MVEKSDSNVMIHATCIAWENQGLLLRGDSGTGKSDLGLRVLESGGMLVSDDQVILTRTNNRLTAQPPKRLEGLLEVRGIGICKYPFLQECDVAAIVDLNHQARPERLPDIARQKETILSIEVPHFILNPFHASAPAKLHAILQLIQ